jgi:hypothetical protein
VKEFGKFRRLLGARQHEPLIEFVCKNAEPTSFKRIDKLGRPPGFRELRIASISLVMPRELRTASLTSSRLIRR